MTPLSPLPFVGFLVALPDAATVVELDPQPYSNTKEILFLNPDTSNRVLVKVVDLSGGLPAVFTAATASVIPAGGSLTLCIGPEGQRNALGTIAFWAANPGSRLGIVMLPETADAAIDVAVTYVQCVGGSTGPGGC